MDDVDKKCSGILCAAKLRKEQKVPHHVGRENFLQPDAVHHVPQRKSPRQTL